MRLSNFTVADKVSGLVLVGPNNPAVGKEALSSPRSFYANVTPQDLVEHVEDITMEGAFKFSNFVPRSFAEQLLTQSDTVSRPLPPISVATKCYE